MLKMFIESEKLVWFCTHISNKKTLSGVSGEWERGRNGAKGAAVPPGRAWETKDLCLGEQNAPHWYLHRPWNWVVAKRAKTWPQEWASACTHPPQLPQTCPWICMVLTNVSLGILLNLPVGHIKVKLDYISVVEFTQWLSLMNASDA